MLPHPSLWQGWLHQTIAQAEKVTSSYVTRVIYLAFLTPDVIKTIMAGKQPPTLSAQRLTQLLPLPLHWHERRALLGFDHSGMTPKSILFVQRRPTMARLPSAFQAGASASIRDYRYYGISKERKSRGNSRQAQEFEERRKP